MPETELMGFTSPTVILVIVMTLMKRLLTACAACTAATKLAAVFSTFGRCEGRRPGTILPGWI